MTWPSSSTKNFVKFHFILLDPKLPHFCAFRYLYTGAVSSPFTRTYTYKLNYSSHCLFRFKRNKETSINIFMIPSQKWDIQPYIFYMQTLVHLDYFLALSSKIGCMEMPIFQDLKSTFIQTYITFSTTHHSFYLSFFNRQKN